MLLVTGREDVAHENPGADMSNDFTPSGALIYTPERTRALLARRGTGARKVQREG